MSRFQAVLMAGLVLAVCGPARQAGATMVVRFGFDSLCVRAQTIAYVRCLGNQSMVDPQTGQIVTRTQFQVLTPVKGDPGSEIVLTLPGGAVDGRGMLVPGVPKFTTGEETVLFLTAPGPSGSPWPIGLEQGCYRMQTDSSGQAQVRLQAGVTPLPSGTLFKPTSSRPFQVPVQIFLNRIRQVLAPTSGER